LDDNAVLIADALGVIRFWSVGAERWFGHLAAVAEGQTLDLIVPQEHRAAHWAGFRRAFETGGAALEGQLTPFPVQGANGEIVEIPGRLSLLRAADGKVTAALIVFG
jgi:PAS domain S-box-containing protein